MPRYDKYDPYDGGFRGELAEDIAAADGFSLVGVGFDANGRVVVGAGNTGLVGACIPHGAKKAGDIVDVMTDGEVVEWTEDGTPTGDAATAGTRFYLDATTGLPGTVAGDPGDTLSVGVTAEAHRLIVRFNR